MLAIGRPGRSILLALVLGLSACTGPQSVVVEQGSEPEIYVLQCTYAAIEPSCRQEADELCPQGWTHNPPITDPEYRAVSAEQSKELTWRILCNE